MSWAVDPMHTQVEFSAKHMGIMTVKGQITGVQAMIDFNEDDFTASSVEATIDARTRWAICTPVSAPTRPSTAKIGG